jgi:predicted AAA+ superfamily ATPase
MTDSRFYKPSKKTFKFAAKKLNAGAINKLKRLLSIIAESVPYEPNITTIAAKSGIHRETVYEFLTYLEQGMILNSIRKTPKGITALQKPHKIYFENPNFWGNAKEGTNFLTKCNLNF